MKRMILAVVATMVLASSTAWGADATASLDINSAYVWRGITFNDGLVAQPGMDVSKGGFAFNVWGNFDLSDYNDTVDKNNFSEVDLTLSYSMDIKELQISIGIIEYLFPAGGAGTRELFGSLGIPIFGGLSAGLNFYYDVDEVHSYYTDLTLTYALELMDGLDLAVGAKAGYAGKDFAQFYSDAATAGGFYDYGFFVSATYALSHALSVGVNAGYTNTLDEDVLPKADIANGIYGHDTEFFAGISLTYAF
jgi:hypothetical protein